MPRFITVRRADLCLDIANNNNNTTEIYSENFPRSILDIV